jgi:hypothetical protein
VFSQQLSAIRAPTHDRLMGRAKDIGLFCAKRAREMAVRGCRSECAPRMIRSDDGEHHHGAA